MYVYVVNVSEGAPSKKKKNFWNGTPSLLLWYVSYCPQTLLFCVTVTDKVGVKLGEVLIYIS